MLFFQKIQAPPKEKKLVKVVNEIQKIKETKTKTFTIDAVLVKKGTIPLKVNDKFEQLSYTITNGSLQFHSAVMDKEALSIIIAVTCPETSTFDLILPRSIIDSKIGDADDDFFVLADFEELEFSEKTTSKDRTLTFSLPTGVEEIEIIGTQLLGISYAGITKPQNIVQILENSGTPHGGKYLEPEVLTVEVGDKVRWENNDSAAHTVTSGTPSDGPNGVFDSNFVMSGNNFELAFNKKGTYNYFCMVHPWKTGKIIVD